jgi:hypothetical protein
MLYLVLPYFDFTDSTFAKQNLDLFVANYGKRDNLRLIICEGIHNPKTALPDYSDRVYKHFKYKLKNILWVKENLINLAIENIPEAEYIAWSDRDIMFLNPMWVEHTIAKLKTNDIVQPWAEVIHLNQQHELELIKKETKQNFYSFASRSTVARFRKKEHSCGASSGQIWAITRNFYDKIEKINDIEIIGGADSVIANYCVLQDDAYEKHLDTKETPSCKNIWKKYRQLFQGCRSDYVAGTIVHFWHGQLERRQYTSRHKILMQQAYDPDIDIGYDENGVLYLTEQGLRLEEGIKNYFTSREVNKKVETSTTNSIYSMSYAMSNCLVPKIDKMALKRNNVEHDADNEDNNEDNLDL